MNLLLQRPCRHTLRDQLCKPLPLPILNPIHTAPPPRDPTGSPPLLDIEKPGMSARVELDVDSRRSRRLERESVIRPVAADACADDRFDSSGATLVKGSHMLDLVVVVVLVSTVIIGTTVGGRYSVAPPVLLIVLGAVLGLIPRLTEVELEPDLVLLLFLPAILYWESLNTSLREIRANLRVIILSSVGLVIVTATTVSLAA